MDSLVKLSGNQCILLAVQLARDSNIVQLQNLTATRRDAFTNEIILRILLTCLPESLEPSAYVDYAQQIAENEWESQDQSIPETSLVKDISKSQAAKKAKTLQLLPLAHHVCQTWEDQDLFTLFLVHRSYRLDQEADLLVLVPQLVSPFLDSHRDLRIWFVSTVLPLLRIQYEYYSANEDLDEELGSLEHFSNLSGLAGVRALMSRSEEPTQNPEGLSYNGARDVRCLVGPWMYGSNARKRRKLDEAGRRPPAPVAAKSDLGHVISRDEESEAFSKHQEWEQAFEYLVQQAAESFEFVTETIEHWNGPEDVDLGGFDDRQHDISAEEEKKLHRRFVQATFASIYAARTDTPATIERAHRLLARLADLMHFEPPPDLATSVEMLPKIDSQSSALFEATPAVLLENSLIQPGHPLTTPTVQTYALLHLFIFSAYLLDGLGCSISVRGVAKTRFQSSADEQLEMLQKLTHTAVLGSRKDEQQWDDMRQKLLWLWSWGFSGPEKEDDLYGEGYLGKLRKHTIEMELLRAFLSAGCFDLVKRTYIEPQTHRANRDLPTLQDVEKCIVESALQFYDNASNGNRTRGGMKKASDIISTFRSSFPQSPDFRRCEALLAATHALSFYSLILQHGVPFQPVSIRVSQDPMSLLQKVLEQNPQSYSKLDDLILISKNLVSAGSLIKNPNSSNSSTPLQSHDVERSQAIAEQRVIGLAIEQALAEDDFETAYSYVTARLNARPVASGFPKNDGSAKHSEDDLAWRAAYVAGRHRSALDTSATAFSTGAAKLRRPGLRRLEQRMELLSQALLLAPQAHLPEVLAAWRRCEEEMGVLLAEEAEEDEDNEEKVLPGGFGPTITPVATRREVGRGAAEEAPMGLFDVAKGAAAAFSRSAFPLHGDANRTRSQAKIRDNDDLGQGSHQRVPSNISGAGSEVGVDSYGQERTRKRDMVASAASGALASGLGWVLGATPTNPRQSHQP